MITCGACGATGLLEGARFCHECGAPTAQQCGTCGEALLAGARFCSSCGAPSAAGATVVPPVPESRPVAERRVTSVLFGDLVGFTTASETRDQEESRELLSRFFDGCRQVVGRYGGTIEKFIGDAVMAVWGVPTTHEDDAERAVRAGLELVRMVTELGGDVGADELAMRVGVVTGEVAVTIGAEQQGMVAGDPVNTASRVQSIAAPGEVWVDETTKLLSSAAISYADVGTHTLKGKADPVALWAARAVIASTGGAARADGLEAPFVGRDRELRLVKDQFHATGENGRAALVVVDGEAGVGKTRIGWEFFKYIDGLVEETYWHQGRCLAYGDGIAYWALAEAVRLRLLQLAGRAGEDDQTSDTAATSSADLVAEGLAAVVPDPDERAWLAARVGALLAGGAIGSFTREELFAAWVTFFERVSAGDQVAFLVDDAQHADEGMLAFVEYLLEAATFPCLVVLLTRPGLLESRPGLATNRRAAVLHLAPLEQRDMATLVNGLVAGLPAEVSAALVDRAEGVPLYAVETVRSLIDRDLLVPRGGQYVLVDPDLDLATIGAPASLQTLVAARLDTLGPAERQVVNQGSILGTSFETSGLRELCPGVELDTAVAELVRLQILTRDNNRLSADYGQLKFVQSVVRQVAYGMLSRHDRKAGHLAAARYLQEHLEAGTEMDAVIAQHYLDAKDALPNDSDVPELECAAIDLLCHAADRAASLGVPEDAAAHLGTALGHASDTQTRADLQRRLATVLIDAGRYSDAIVSAQEATEAFDALGNDVSAGRAAAAWARALIVAGDPASGLDLAQPRFDVLRERDDADRAALELSLAVTSAQMGLGLDFREGVDFRMRSADRLDEPGHLAEALAVLGIHYSTTGAFGVGRIFLEASARHAREHQLPGALARALVNLAAFTQSTNLVEAAGFAQEAVAVAQRAGNTMMLASAEANLVLVLSGAGRWTELDAALADANALRRSTFSDTAYVPQTLAALDRSLTPPPSDTRGDRSSEALADRSWYLVGDAADALVMDDKVTALARAVEATRIMRDLGGAYDDFFHAFGLAVNLAADLRDPERYSELIELVDGVASPVAVQAYAVRLRGLLAATDGSPAGQAETALREAIDLFEQWGSPPERARTQCELALLLTAEGRSDEADELLADARRTYEELGASGRLQALAAQSEVAR
ncbi:class 3 adenylate cyclase/tetratricopeptide (TPR) repeat protein [Marmoricola sp. URHA0025 HA25]